MNPWQAAFQGWLERALYKWSHRSPGRYLSETAVIEFVMDSDCGLAEEEKINVSYINSQKAEVIHWKQWSDSDGKLSTMMIHVNNSNQSVSWNDQSKNGKQGEHAIPKGWHHDWIIPAHQEHLTKEVLPLAHHFPSLPSTKGSKRFLCTGFHTQCLSPTQNASPRKPGSAVSFIAEGISDVLHCLLCCEFSAKTKMMESEWTSTQQGQ